MPVPCGDDHLWEGCVMAVLMGILTCAALRLFQVLAGISEQEEQGCSSHDELELDFDLLPPPPPTLPSPSPTPRPRPSRSLQATPEKRRDASRDRDVTPSTTTTQPPLPRRRRGHRRRSLSLPTGSLSYGDVRISYRDGHFVTEPVVDDVRGERSGNDRRHSGGVVCGSWMNVSSEEEMREEILCLLEQGFTADDVALLLSRYLRFGSGQQSEEEEEDEESASAADDLSRQVGLSSLSTPSICSSPSPSLYSIPSLNSTPSHYSSPSHYSTSHCSTPSSPGRYSTRSLPRRFRREQRDDVSRPVSSVDDVRDLSQSELSLASSLEGGGDSPALTRGDSFFEAMSLNFDPAREGGEEVLEVEVFSKGGEEWVGATRMRRSTTTTSAPTPADNDGAQTERGRSQRPGFIQRMLQKRKSFHDKPNTSPSKEDSGSLTRKEPVSRRVSIKGIFRRKSSASLDAKKEPDEAKDAPPIATFMRDDDIGAMTSLPGSPAPAATAPAGRRTKSDSQVGPESGDRFVWPAAGRSRSVGSDKDVADRSLSEVVRQRLPSDGYIPDSVRFSGEYDNVGEESATPRDQSNESLTPRSPPASFCLTPDEDSQSPDSPSRRTQPEAESSFSEESSRTYSLGSENGESRSWTRALGSDSYASQSGSILRGGGSNAQEDGKPPPDLSGHPPRPSRKPSLSRKDSERVTSAGSNDVTNARHSNDSGIQHDVTLSSAAQSFKIPPEVERQLTNAVKLRNSPSPKQERPKSDFTVRWADLLEQVRETDVIYRRDGVRLRQRARPKSDLAEDSGEDEGVAYDDSSSCDEGPSPSHHLPSSQPLLPLSGALGAAVSGVTGRGVLSVMGHQHQQQQQQHCGTAVWGTATINSISNFNSSNISSSTSRLRGHVDMLAIPISKARRMSTPHPIKCRVAESKVTEPKTRRCVSLVRCSSMPDNLDRLHRKKSYFSLIGYELHNEWSHHSGGDDSSDESELSVDYPREKSLSARSSRVTLTTIDQMMSEEENLTYAEALWDHVTMDPDELGFRAGDVIRVMDSGDKHWWYGATQHRDGWFPAAFVRLRVNQDDLDAEMGLRLQGEEEEEARRQLLRQTETLPPSSPSHKSQLRANVVKEIITAETEYVKHLRDVIEGYLKQARKRPEMFPVEKVTVIFSNIEVIYGFATKLLADLRSAVNTQHPHLTQFGHCFLNKAQDFELYSEYCNNHPAACEELREMYRVKRYRHFFEACRLLQDMTEIPLEGFLLTPVQKICKYHLQLAELLKYTPEDHADYPHVRSAVEAMKSIAKLVNERKRKMESIETLAEWQSLVDDWEGPDILDESSELIYSGELNKINPNGWSQERYFFLFDHQLVYCKKDLLKKNSFGYKGRIGMDHSIVVPLPDGKDAQYNVTVRNAFKVHDQKRNKWYLMVAKTPQIQQRWLKAFADERRRVQDDAENNFNIPSHLKQAIVSSFKQKSTGSKSKVKRKSRNSSMRTSKTSSWVSTNATLPRLLGAPPPHHSTPHQGGKFMTFFLGARQK